MVGLWYRHFNFEDKEIFGIDHVIPLSKFGLTENNNIAFNWRNTTLPITIENLPKGVKFFLNN
jgi:hypothetical protein